jgi:hypothetical protein
MGQIKRLSTLSIFLILALLSMTLSKSQPSFAADEATQPIGGYFIYAATNASANTQKLDAIKATGADTIITFGSRLRPVTLDGNGLINMDGAVDPKYKDCVLNGQNCVSAMQSKVSVNRIFTYSDKSLWNGKARKCGNDVTFNSKGKSYTILAIPTMDNGCSSANGIYDLVVIANSSENNDASTALATGAAERGMKFYAGMPAPVIDARNGWLPDTSYTATMEKFTDRFMLEYASKYNTAGLGGFYHHFEQNLASSWTETLNLYSMQNRLIAKHFGTTKYAMISPYLESRKGKGITPDIVASNMLKLVGTSNGVPMIMAPQDGVGSALGALYYGNEGNSPVDKYNVPVSGAGTYAETYVAPFSSYYEAMSNSLKGTGVQFWGNLEAFSASKDGANTCTNTNNRGSTTKDRLNKQIQLATPHTIKNISFMWDDYYTCGLSNGTTLGDDMLARKAEPIVVSASLENGTLSVAGFNLGVDVAIEGNGLSEKLNVIQQNASPNAATGAHPGISRTVFALPKGNFNTSGYYSISATTVAGSSRLPVYFDIPLSGSNSASSNETSGINKTPTPDSSVEEKAKSANKPASEALSAESKVKQKGKFQPIPDISEADSALGVILDEDVNTTGNDEKASGLWILLALFPLGAAAMTIRHKIRKG